LGKTQYSSGHNGRYGDAEYIQNVQVAVKKAHDKKYGAVTKFTVNCYKCGIKFEVNERAGLFPLKEKYFCSAKCSSGYSASFLWTDEYRKKVAQDGKFGFKDSGRRAKSFKSRMKDGYKQKELTEYTCLECNGSILSAYPRKFCSRKCTSTYKRKEMDQLQAYRLDASFDFNLKDYSDKFDFDLIKKYGWYSPTNKNNNLAGVSRDHMVSVKFGFENNIDPDIISHPANCQLLKHTDNIIKKEKCSITISELMERIKNWKD